MIGPSNSTDQTQTVNVPPSSPSPSLLHSTVFFLANGQLHSFGHLASELGVICDHVPTAKVSTNPPSSTLGRQWTQPDDLPHRTASTMAQSLSPLFRITLVAPKPVLLTLCLPLSLFSTQQPEVLIPHSPLGTPSPSLPSRARGKPRGLTVLQCSPRSTLPSPCFLPFPHEARHDPASRPLHCASPPWTIHPEILWVFIEMPACHQNLPKIAFLIPFLALFFSQHRILLNTVYISPISAFIFLY